MFFVIFSFVKSSFCPLIEAELHPDAITEVLNKFPCLLVIFLQRALNHLGKRWLIFLAKILLLFCTSFSHFLERGIKVRRMENGDRRITLENVTWNSYVSSIKGFIVTVKSQCGSPWSHTYRQEISQRGYYFIHFKTFSGSSEAVDDQKFVSFS